MKNFVLCMIVLMVGMSLSAYASTPSTQPRLTTKSFTDQILVEEFGGGDVLGYGKASKNSVTTAQTTIATTDVSADGVYTIQFYNSGSVDVYGSLNGSAATTSNCNFILPPAMAMQCKSKKPCTSIKMYCPTGSSTVYVRY